MTGLTFTHPWLFLLLGLPLLVHWFLPPSRHTRRVLRVPFCDRVMSASSAGTHVSKASSKWPLLIKCLLWALVVTAIARPQRLEPPLTKSLPTRDLLLLVDISTSMEKDDFTNESGEAVNRLEAVKEVVGEFLLKREGDRVGLVVFGGAAFLQVPFTTDLELCRQLLEETAIGMAGPKTALGDAIGLGINLFDESDLEAQTIIALTDGNDTSSMVPPVEASRIARDRGIRIHSIAMGDPLTVGEEKLDEETLQEVSETAGGSYFLAMNREELTSVYNELDKIEQTTIETVSHQPRTDLYFYPLALALLIAGLGVAASLLKKKSGARAQEHPRMRVNSRTFELEITSP